MQSAWATIDKAKHYFNISHMLSMSLSLQKEKEKDQRWVENSVSSSLSAKQFFISNVPTWDTTFSAFLSAKLNLD